MYESKDKLTLKELTAPKEGGAKPTREVETKIEGIYSDVQAVKGELDGVASRLVEAENRGLVKEINRDGYGITDLKSDMGLGTAAEVNNAKDVLETPDAKYDSTRGYQEFSKVLTKSGELWICVSAEKGNAVWRQLVPISLVGSTLDLDGGNF